jgi:hypothetical protein
MSIKTSGFNLKDMDRDNSEMDSLLDTEDVDIRKELKLKKKKINFDGILPRPKVDKCMGMCGLKDEGNPFKELY